MYCLHVCTYILYFVRAYLYTIFVCVCVIRALGLAQCAELCWQLRGLAGPRQVKDCRAALQHNLGLGGAAVVAVYTMPKFAAGAAPQLAANFPHSEAVGKAPTAAAAPVAAAAPARASASSGTLKADAVFAELKKHLSADLVKKASCNSLPSIAPLSPMLFVSFVYLSVILWIRYCRLLLFTGGMVHVQVGVVYGFNIKGTLRSVCCPLSSVCVCCLLFTRSLTHACVRTCTVR